MTKEELGLYLRDRREGRGLTQAEVAQRLGLASGNLVTMYEKGRRRFRSEKLETYAGILGVDAQELAEKVMEAYHPALKEALGRNKQEKRAV